METDLKTMLDNGSLFNSISESAPFGLFVTDTEGLCIYANAEYLAITGLSQGEVYSTGWSQTIHPDDRARILEMLYTATETHETFSAQYRIIDRDARQMCVQIRGTPINLEGRVVGIVGALEDITLRLKMESQLRINFAAMESSTSMIMITDRHGLITWVNPAFSRGTGYSFAEIDGKNPGFLSVSPDSPIKQAIQKIITTRQPWTGEVFNRRKDGSVFLEEEIITPILGTDSKISHFLAIKRDITLQRENEQKLAEYSEHLEDLVKERTRELEEAQKRILLQLRLEQDLTIAAQIQLSLLPEKPPSVLGFEIACRAFAAHYISGDLYDFVLKDKQNLYILMADISGKGMPAALLSASARIVVREKILQTDSPAEILDLVNRALYDDLNKTEMFITMMLARLNPETGECAYSNAGHTRSMHWHGETQSISLLGATSMPVGVFPELAAAERTIMLDALDMLFVYSDGLTEAVSPAGDLLGEEALANSLALEADRQPNDILEDLVAYVDTFSAYSLPDDDRTLILVKRNSNNRVYTLPLSTGIFSKIMSLAKNEAGNCSDQFFSELELVTTELVTNIITHAYGLDPKNLDTHDTYPDEIPPTIDVQLKNKNHLLIIDVYDHGKAFEQETYIEPDPLNLQVGGYGYLLIRKLTDAVIYTREPDNRNHWHLEKSIKEKA
jgi:phosphoserine phosphatase RsbU/P